MSCSSILKRSAHQARGMLHCIHRSCRRAATSANPFPYPTHANPQPHQIFHLPRSATQQEIKERYYDLVRIYHPDAPVARAHPAATAHARFQAISRAYDVMRGRSAVTGDGAVERQRPVDPARFRFRPETRRRPHFDDTPGDERWKERALFAATVLAVVAWVAQTRVARCQAVGEIAHGARESSGAKRSLTDEALAESTASARSR